MGGALTGIPTTYAGGTGGALLDSPESIDLVGNVSAMSSCEIQYCSWRA